MIFQIGKKYKIILNINEHVLTYSCTLLSEDNNFITFIDKFGKEYTYNKNLILSIERIKNFN